MTRGIEVVVQEKVGCEEIKIRPASFTQTFVSLQSEIDAHVSLVCSIFSVKMFWAVLSSHLMNAVNEHLVSTTKPIGDFGTMIKACHPTGSPQGG